MWERADCGENREGPSEGLAPFVGGVTRPVYEDADGRQWVVGYDGEPAYGVWLRPPDEPVAASLRDRRNAGRDCR
jgi:hypothetical protein